MTMSFLDERHMRVIGVKNMWGAGLIGSVHMPCGNQEKEYKQQLEMLLTSIRMHKPDWVIMPGDYNRDIRHHQYTVHMLDKCGLKISPMENEVQWPKDFVVTSVPSEQMTTGRWLWYVADHPVIL